MARSKWISFAAQHSLNKEAQKAAQSADVPPPLPVPAEVKKFGLENFGNTCYANSVLQALYFCTPFRDLMLQALDSSVPNGLPAIPIATSGNAISSKPQVRRQPERKASTAVVPTESTSVSSTQPSAMAIPASPPTLFSALRSLFINISTQPGDKGTVAPKAFIDKLKELNDIFRSTMHQDAHEFLNYLLNRIVEEMEAEKQRPRSSIHGEDLTASIATLGSTVPPTVASSTSGTNARDATLVHRLFEGVLTSETRCLTCETVSSRDESFLDLSIDIEQNSSVTACLRQFSASEMLCNRNKFFCDSCCDLQEAEKRMKIKKLPNVLALHLKRFKYQEDVGRYIKLSYRVAFPMELRLFNTVDDMEDADRLYNLFAIVVHIGNGPHHGHYISIIKNGGSWFVFDDDNVYPIPESDIPKYFGDSNSGSAYVLYYQADDIDLVTLGVQPPPPPTPPLPPTVAPSDSPDVQPSLTLVAQPVAGPPGLETYELPLENADFQIPATLPNKPLIPNDKPPLTLSPVIVNATPDAAEQSSNLASASSPSTARFGAKFMNTIRRAPSASLTKANISATASSSTTESQKSLPDRSPRLSASSPSLHGREETNHQTPLPPVPPLPPHILTTAPTLPLINGDEKDKEKKKESKSPGGWFTKRKSLRLGDKNKTPVGSPGAPQPPSPNRRNHEDHSTTPLPSNWFRGFSSSQRDGQTADGGRSKDTTSDASYSDHLTPKNGLAPNGSLSPYDELPSTPGSTSSSLNSASASASNPPSTSLRPSTGFSTSTGVSTASSSASAPKKNFFGQDRRSTHEPPKSKTSRNSSPSNRQRPFPPSTSKKSGDFERALPPLPPHPPPSTSSHHFGPESTQTFFTEPEAHPTNGFHHDGSNTSFPSAPPTSFPDDLRTHQHQRSTTLPPTSLAFAAGVNTSNGSHSSTSSGIRKATRKLSLTAPMLGFGRSKEKK